MQNMHKPPSRLRRLAKSYVVPFEVGVGVLIVGLIVGISGSVVFPDVPGLRAFTAPFSTTCSIMHTLNVMSLVYLQLNKEPS
jgi:uncharacterized membrane protein